MSKLQNYYKRILREIEHSSNLINFINTIPLYVPVSLSLFSIVAMTMLLTGQFKTTPLVIAWLAALLVSFLTLNRKVKIIEKGSKPENFTCSLVVIVFVAIWVVFGALHSSQHIFTNRDPASYAIGGAWLAEHEDLNISKNNILSDVPNIETHSGGFTEGQSEERLYVRGPHLFSGLLGIAGRAGGDQLMLRINTVIGGIALLAIYGYARLIVRPKWALLATVAVAATLPFIHFSRSTYTEPLTAAFIFSALSMLWYAQKSSRLYLWFVAGLVAGSTALVRIDAYLPIAALLFYLFINLSVIGKPSRNSALRNVSMYGLGVAISAALGWLSVMLLSGRYYTKHLPLMLAELGVIGVAIITGCLIVILAWRTTVLHEIEVKSRSWRTSTIVFFFLLAAVLLITRSMWYESHITLENGEAGHLRYANNSVNWLAWYIGPALTLFGFIGIVISSVRILKNRRYLQLVLPGLLVVFSTSLLYFIRPSVAPDHIWAARRFVPVIIPGFALYGVYFIESLNNYEFKFRRFVVCLLGAFVVAGPLITSYPFLTTRTHVPQLQRIKDVCSALPNNAVVIWLGRARTEAIQPTRVYCDVYSAGYGRSFRSDMPGTEELSRIAASARNKGLTPVIGLYGDDRHSLSIQNNSFSTVHESTEVKIEQTFLRPPKKTVGQRTSILLGVIDKTGKIKPVEIVN